MSASVLIFPSSDEARRRAIDRWAGQVIPLLVALGNGDKEPQDEREEYLKSVAIRLKNRAAQIKAERVVGGQA